MSDNKKINAALFRYLYSSLTPPIPTNIAERIADDFFSHCLVQKSNDLFYIADHVIPCFFQFYFETKTKTIVKDDCYKIVFDEDLNLFIDTVSVIVNYLYDGVNIELCKDEIKPTWRITKK